MNVRLAGEVSLPLWREFPKIMPEAGKVAPLAGCFPVGVAWAHPGGEVGGPVGDFVEVTVVGFEVAAFCAGLALTFLRTIPKRGEKRFPLGRFLRKIRMAVGNRWSGHWWERQDRAVPSLF